MLAFVAEVERPDLVVDLGCGTGLSTRAWSGRAELVVGVEPNAAMLGRARRATGVANVRYVQAFAADTGLPAGGVDLVTCSQAFHWMEPAPVLLEASRLLRPGGVFAAYDYDVPPVVHPEVDVAFAEHAAARAQAWSRLGAEPGAKTWPKERHLEQIRSSGHFRFAREIVCHGWDEVDHARIIGLAQSFGGPLGLFGDEAPRVRTTFHRLEATASRLLGERTWPMVLPLRVRLGIA